MEHKNVTRLDCKSFKTEGRFVENDFSQLSPPPENWMSADITHARPWKSFIFFQSLRRIKNLFPASNCLFRSISHKTGGTNWSLDYGDGIFLLLRRRLSVYDSSSSSFGHNLITDENENWEMIRKKILIRIQLRSFQWRPVFRLCLHCVILDTHCDVNVWVFNSAHDRLLI